MPRVYGNSPGLAVRMPSTSSAVYSRSMGRPEIVVKLLARSGDFFSAGSSVSRSQRCFAVSATVFMPVSHYSGGRSTDPLSDAAAVSTRFDGGCIEAAGPRSFDLAEHAKLG